MTLKLYVLNVFSAIGVVAILDKFLPVDLGFISGSIVAYLWLRWIGFWKYLRYL